VTRAKKLVVLAGSRRALAVAVRTRGAGRRHTSLDYRLQSALLFTLPPPDLNAGATGVAS
jgi:hypothetical protein